MKKRSKGYLMEGGQVMPISRCPICHDSKTYRPQALYNHFMSDKHSKEDFADFLEEEISWNRAFDYLE